jgi:putative glutamine amidotransferase
MTGGAPRRPVIGISSYAVQAQWGVWDRPAVVLPQNYVDQVAGAGGIPVLLPPVPGIEDAVHQLDGLIISGGPDVEPVHYGEQPDPRTVISPARDAAEFALFRRAMQVGLPVLGICRGMQLINVALGGTLIQHLPDVVGHDGHGSPEPGQMGAHEVTVAPSCRLAGIVGGTGTGGGKLAVVPTHHHQGVDRLGAGLTATAWAADGTIEAFELSSAEHPFTIAVQWHPEAGEDPGIFMALVTAAASRMAPA